MGSFVRKVILEVIGGGISCLCFFSFVFLDRAFFFASRYEGVSMLFSIDMAIVLVAVVIVFIIVVLVVNYYCGCGCCRNCRCCCCRHCCCCYLFPVLLKPDYLSLSTGWSNLSVGT